MTSVVPRGTAARMVARTFFSVERAGWGIPARYSFTLAGARAFFMFPVPAPYAAEARSRVYNASQHEQRLSRTSEELTGRAASGTMSCPLCGHGRRPLMGRTENRPAPRTHFTLCHLNFPT